VKSAFPFRKTLPSGGDGLKECVGSKGVGGGEGGSHLG